MISFDTKIYSYSDSYVCFFHKCTYFLFLLYEVK